MCVCVCVYIYIYICRAAMDTQIEYRFGDTGREAESGMS